MTGLCAVVRARLEGCPSRVVVCDVGGLGPPGLGTVDLLARLQLTARRAGGRIRLRDPDPALHALLDLVGLRFEVEGQPEEREPALGVEEAVEPGDPPPEISRTCTAHGVNPPASGSGLYWANPGSPLTWTGTRREPAQGAPIVVMNPVMSPAPVSHRSNGGIVMMASSCSSSVSAVMSYPSKAAT